MTVHHHPQNKAVIDRLSRAIGHLEAVKRMAQEENDCSELLIQISAVLSAINGAAKMILADHVRHCLSDDDPATRQVSIDQLIYAIDRYLGTSVGRVEPRH
jgi:DNA-binding FrmR family transcriptional regulator